MTSPASQSVYTVNYWGSHPDAGNDDCFTALEFETPEEALDQYLSDENPLPVYPAFMTTCCAYIEIEGVIVTGIRPNLHYHCRSAKRERQLDDTEWKQEATWQARMGGDLTP